LSELCLFRVAHLQREMAKRFDDDDGDDEDDDDDDNNNNNNII
jgi:hypothetical protein